MGTRTPPRPRGAAALRRHLGRHLGRHLSRDTEQESRSGRGRRLGTPGAQGCEQGRGQLQGQEASDAEPGGWGSGSAGETAGRGGGWGRGLCRGRRWLRQRARDFRVGPLAAKDTAGSGQARSGCALQLGPDWETLRHGPLAKGSDPGGSRERPAEHPEAPSDPAPMDSHRPNSQHHRALSGLGTPCGQPQGSGPRAAGL